MHPSLRCGDSFTLTGACSPPLPCGVKQAYLSHQRQCSSRHRRHSCSRKSTLPCWAVQSSLDEAPSGSRDGTATKDAPALPTDWERAVGAGKVSQEVQQRNAALLENPLLAPFLRWQGFQERLLADPGFLVKLGIEVGIGLCTKTTAEATKRGPSFVHELDFVAANVLMALLADFCLVWLPAPTVSLGGGSRGGAVEAVRRSPVFELAAACPDNCFQKVQSGGQGYSVAQRAGALLVNGTKLLAVGTVASLAGVGAVNGLIAVREHLDPSWTPLNPPQDVLRTSIAYGVYMATSSNLRYQIMAGIIEERGVEVWFKGQPRVCGALSFVLRTSNTFIGSLLWIDFVRLLGMQSAGPH